MISNLPTKNSPDGISLLEVIETAGCQIQLSVEIEPSFSAKIRERAFKEFAKDIRLPGFRPGKIPIQYLKARYLGQVESKWSQLLAEEALQIAVELSKRSPYAGSNIQYDWKRLAFDQVSQLQANFEATPLVPDEIDVFSLKTELPEQPKSPTDVEIEELLKEEQMLSLPSLDRPSAVGDFVAAAVFETSKPSNILFRETAVQLNSDLQPDWVLPLLLDLRSGESRHTSVQVKMGAEPIECRVQMHRVFELPDMPDKPIFNDEFAKSAGFENLGQMRDAVESRVIFQRSAALHRDAQTALLKSIVESLDFEVPKSALEKELNAIAPSPGQDLEQESKRRETALIRLRRYFLIAHWARIYPDLVTSDQLDTIVRANLHHLPKNLSQEEAFRQVQVLYQNARLTLTTTKVIERYLANLGWSPTNLGALTPPSPG